MAAGCYLLVSYSRPEASATFRMPEPSEEESASDARALGQLATTWKEQDTEIPDKNLAEDAFSTGSLEPTKRLTPPGGRRNRVDFPSSNPIARAPMPHTSGWQTVPLADPSKSLSEIDVQGTSQLDGAKVAVTPAESSPGPAFGEPTVHSVAEMSLRKGGEEAFMATSSKHAKSDTPKSETPKADSDREAIAAQSERPDNSTPETAPGETIDGVATRVVAGAAVSAAPEHPETAAASTADTGKEGPPDDIAVVKPPDPNGPPFGEASVHLAAESGLHKGDEEVFMAPSSDPYELLPRWLEEMQRKSDATSLSGSELVLQRKESAGGGSIAAARSPTLVANAKSDSPKSAVSPVPANPEMSAAGNGKEWTPEDVAVVKMPELNEQLRLQPKETEMASRGKSDEAPAPTEEPRKPRGYIAVEPEPVASRNPGTEDFRPKRQDHPPKIQDHSQKVQDRSLAVQDSASKAPDHPLKVQDNPSEPEEKSADLRRFASAFLQADRAGNIADQHRFYADSVHFYREGDLSWTGVAAATRRYHQERQNTRFGTEGTAAVKGPVNGGFYVVEQPVSWSRAEGSRLKRGRSVLRLRVVPINRGGWKITSIEEIGQ